MTDELHQRLNAFAKYAEQCHDEKGHSQVFMDRLFRALGHDGYKEAGAVLEDRVRKKGGRTRFIDLSWPDRRVLIEMKKRGESLGKHFPQLRGYWLDTVGWRARYLALCNFEELWIYDTEVHTSEPVEKLLVSEIAHRWASLGFMLPVQQEPLFHNNAEQVSTDIAKTVAELFRRLVERNKDRDLVQRFVLQTVVCMFAEDIDLLPNSVFTRALLDCQGGLSTYDVLGGLFRQMNSPELARAGRFVDVPYFNGGLFAETEAIELDGDEVALLLAAAECDWSSVDPAIFGTIFQHSLEAVERHSKGAHYTSEADIQKIVVPTIVRPWRERIEAANTLRDLLAVRTELTRFKVLDPSCGSGNFLYVAYREMRRLELEILTKIRKRFPKGKARGLGLSVSIRQFYGFDILPFATEIAKVTMMLGKELSIREMEEILQESQMESAVLVDPALPLENLDDRIRCADALLESWPDCDAIIGNPPFISKNKAQKELGRVYLNDLRKRFPDVPGRADYCAYFFRKAHDALGDGRRAGLVGTNSIRQNYSRIGSLDYVVAEGGCIYDAVATQRWSGDAVVHVSIVNWLRGEHEGRKPIRWQDEAGLWHMAEVDVVPSSLNPEIDVTGAHALVVNKKPKVCFQGVTHGHDGFLVTLGDVETLVRAEPDLADVLFPYLTADDMLSSESGDPRRYVIDFQRMGLFDAQRYAPVFGQVKETVLPTRQESAKSEEERNQEALLADPKARVNHHHANFLAKWWQLSYCRADMVKRLNGLPRYIACGRVTKRPIFSFVSPRIRPGDALAVFALDDDYSFGVLQSTVHWGWFEARCSTLKGDPRYTSNTVFDSFPWPQNPTKGAVQAVAIAARSLRKTRTELQREHGIGLRELYRLAELPGENPLRASQEELDRAVATAYGTSLVGLNLEYLLALNATVQNRIADGEPVLGPGIPPRTENAEQLKSADCIGVLS